LVAEVDLGIAVVAYRSRSLVLRCVESVAAELGDLDWCLAVVNNSPGDATVPTLAALADDRVVARDAPCNLGFAAGCNLAVRTLPAPCRHILLLNPDTELRDSSVAELIGYLDRHAGVGIAGAQLLFPDGRLQPSVRRFPSFPRLLFARRSPLARLAPANRRTREYLYADRPPDSAGPVDVVAGAALAIRRALWDELRGMDESFFLYAEDSDLCYRAAQRGYATHLVPAARIWHAWGGASSQHRWAATVEHQRSVLRFLRKHRRVPPSIGVLLGLVVAAQGLVFRLPGRR